MTTATPLSAYELNEKAIDLLLRELGDADTARFIRQVRHGSDDYTADRIAWLAGRTVEELASEMRTSAASRTAAALVPGGTSAVVEGTVCDLGRPYSDGTPRLEIHVPAGRSDGLPVRVGERVPIRLNVADRVFEGGLRATPANKYVWVCPDLRGSGGEETSLGRVLTTAGFSANESVRVRVEGNALTVERNGH